MKRFIDNILDIHSTDPDDMRRGRLLNILLLGILGVSVLGLIALIIDSFTRNESTQAERQITLIGMIVFAIGVLGIYQINRKYSARWAALLFLLLLTGIFVVTDSPQELTQGRSLFLFTIPIIMSSLTLAPQASFLLAGISSVIVSWLSLTIGLAINPFVIFGFFVLALVSWLSARSLEDALKDLRAINANLDHVVAERTQALAESLDREKIEAGQNRAILNSIADGVIVFDRNWNATLANPAIRGMLEIPLELIVNKNFREIIEHPRLKPASRGLLYAMIDQDTQPIGFRIEWAGKTLSVSAAQIYNKQSKNIGTVTVFRDFTREAEVERLKSRFVAMVSHELRTPLNAILGYSEMFKEAVYGPINDKQLNMADRIMKNTQRLLGLINDLLDQAQMEAGKLTIQMAPLRPVELLENLHSVMDKIVQDKGVQLFSEIENNVPEMLNGDAARLQQILVNLVNNAVKFTDQGSVKVRIFCTSDTAWGMEISDTGHGIPEAELPYIFETFHQVDSAATREHGGFGLGLSIVKELVNLMNGTIKVQSKKNEGSTFIVTLPLAISEKIVENWRNS